jgi:hypothetical protein
LADLDQAIVDAVEHDKPVTVRGVFYRVMSAGAVPKTEKGYAAVGRRLVHLRRAGRVSYADITDGTRWIARPRTYDGWEEALRDSANSYRQALWNRSAHSLQLFTEKDAITGVIHPVTDAWDVPLGVLRGYSSESFAWRVGQSIDPYRVTIIGQLGDHDPSGVGAWRDFTTKVRAFAPPDANVCFERLAVVADQIEEMNLPMRPTKTSDSRSRGWVGGSVEVDAIPAPALRGIVNNWIAAFHDSRELEYLRSLEMQERDVLQSFLRRTRQQTQ